jgi:hypothetical protein
MTAMVIKMAISYANIFTIFLIIAVLFIYMMEIAYIQRKKSLRIPKGQSESVYRRRTDNTTVVVNPTSI